MRVFDKLVVVGLVAGITLTASLAPAQKGGGGGTPSGTIFYKQFGNNFDHYLMNADGSGKTFMFAADTRFETPHPSYGTYNGQRWFVHTREILVGTNQCQAVVVFTSSSGLQQRVYPLADPAPLDSWGMTTGWHTRSARWLPGDAEISFVGFRLSEDQVSQEAGFYSTPVHFDGVGPVVQQSFSVKLSPGTYHASGGVFSVVGSYDWNPSGTAIVYAHRNDLGLYTASSNSNTKFYGGYADQPAWSTQNVIVFTEGINAKRLYTINVNGTGLKQVASTKDTPKDFKTLWAPFWSPDGNFLCYIDQTSRHGGPAVESILYRVTAGGASRTKLADAWRGLGWR
jgi:hypothetical protein